MKEDKGDRSIVIETISRLMLPFIQLFSMYVIIHATCGPGGGFQGGVVFGSSVILYIITFSLTDGRKRFPELVNIVLNSCGLYIYVGIGLLSILFSAGAAQYLNYGFIPFTGHFEENRALGIELVEIGIGLIVMATVASIFFNLVHKAEPRDGREEMD